MEIGKIKYAQGSGQSQIKNLNTSKIKKFIEKQKKRNAEKNKEEKTLEHEKIMRVHQNLIKLHNFTLNNRIKNSHSTATN